MCELDIIINNDYWECYGCKTKQINSIKSVDKAPFFQVDAVEDNYILLSNYYEQKLIKYEGNAPPINSPYCRSCVDDKPGLNNSFEPEINNYTFEQNGKTCWDLEKCKLFTRDCGNCVSCGDKVILKSLFNNSQTKDHFLIWSPYLASRCIPDPCSPQIWKSLSPSKFYIEGDHPTTVCSKCFQENNWLPYDGPIKCYLCDKSYQRWIFHFTVKPVKDGCGCYCHAYQEITDGKETIMDGYVDPEEYEWVDKARDNFDPNKPFCINCLTEFVNIGKLKSLFEPILSDDETQI